MKIFVVAALLLLVGCARAGLEIPRQESALAQYFYARERYYDPAFEKKGAARQDALRDAVAAFQAVVREFPGEPECTTRALAEYYTGLCQLQLGETERARASFIRCREYRRFATSSMHAAGRATLIAISERALDALRDLDGK
ncbi:MAG: hypothetical protein FJX76_02045 [Armatimonadetes bacterium]|nr:hypothetical protein [Armatimonadota bacterium]